MATRKKQEKQPVRKIQPKRVQNLSPGTVRYTGKKTALKTKLDIIDYSKDHYERIETKSISDAYKYEDETHITWINVNGLTDTDAIVALGSYFELHPLIQEDIVAIHQRPKIDEYENYLFIVFKMLQYTDTGKLIIEHVSLVLGKDYILTFQEAEGDTFDDLRERIEHGKGRVRNSGSDYLMFAVLDAVVDHYFAVADFLVNKIEVIEDQLFRDENNPNLAEDIQRLKKEVLKIRKAVLPLREVINRLDKIESDLIEARTYKYIRDLYDNIIQMTESIEIHREMTWSLMDMYLSTINNKMNEVMKILTIVASIFIPLTLLTGIYGMNFDNMPELHYKYSYFIFLGVMVFLLIGMVWFFKKKRWF